jgi:hypothetical protein
VEIIANDQGNRITPSYVAWNDAGDRLVGEGAKSQATLNPEQTVFDVKCLIGRQFKDKTEQHDKKLFPFKLIERRKCAPTMFSNRFLLNLFRKHRGRAISAFALPFFETLQGTWPGDDGSALSPSSLRGVPTPPQRDADMGRPDVGRLPSAR